MGGREDDSSDRVGFYLLPRYKTECSTPSSAGRKQRIAGETEQSSETYLPSSVGRSQQGRLSSRRNREGRKQPNLEGEKHQNNSFKRTLPRSSSKRLSNNHSKTPEVLFDSTPLYLPKDLKEKRQETRSQSDHKVKVEERPINDIKAEKNPDTFLKTPTKRITENSTRLKSTEAKSMLSKRSGQKQANYNPDVEETIYPESDEDKPDEVFRSVSPGTGDIHNMRIHAGIMINTSRRQGQGRYNSSRFVIIFIENSA